MVKPSDIQNDEFRLSEINNRGTVLVTETGYLMLVKSFTDDLAWKVQRQLVNCYFKAKDYSECYSTDDFESERTIDSEQLIKCAEIMAGCLDGNKIYVLNILRHIVPDINEMPFSYEQDFDAADISDKTHIKSSVPIAGYSIDFDAQKFDRYLRENGISSLELSERLQCGSGNPWKWRSGTVSPGTYYRTKICEVLELPIGYFDKKTRKRR